MTLVEEVALVGALGVVLVAGAVWSFGRQLDLPAQLGKQMRPPLA